VFWINMIKGFGLMLAIWLILSLLVIIFVSRVLLLFLALKLKDKKLFVGYKK
jgi:preprotein translocase subunit SecD